MGARNWIVIGGTFLVIVGSAICIVVQVLEVASRYIR